MRGELAGKVALVTGAGRAGGIGAAIAARLAVDGCRVVLTDVVGDGKGLGSDGELAARVAEIEAAGGDAASMPCDVRDEQSVVAAVEQAVQTWGGLDILVNNAGVGFLMSPLVETSVEDWDTVLDVNLRGAFIATREAARAMIDRGRGGRIINIASQAAKSGFPHASAYCSSKHGMVGLTRVSAIELGPHGITVNAVCPNHITTGLGAWQNAYFSKLRGQSEQDYLAAMRGRIPLGRPGLTSDIAGVCAFLCSEAAQYVTGEAINVSGGEEMH
ncbi:MAG: SDR family NAD(P)-dependent oxidoreductase [Steroidobacteraceae bacterium]